MSVQCHWETDTSIGSEVSDSYWETCRWKIKKIEEGAEVSRESLQTEMQVWNLWKQGEKSGTKASEGNAVLRKSQPSWKGVRKHRLSFGGAPHQAGVAWLWPSSMLSSWLEQPVESMSVVWMLENLKVLQLKTISSLRSSQQAVMKNIWAAQRHGHLIEVLQLQSETVWREAILALRSTVYAEEVF